MFGGINQLKTDALIAQFLERGAQVIDVRSRQEYASGGNPNHINIPLEEIGKELRQLDKNKPTIVVCRSGNRSGMAMQQMKIAGFNDIMNGGAWENVNN